MQSMGSGEIPAETARVARAAFPKVCRSKSRRRTSRGVSVLVDEAAEDPGAEQSVGADVRACGGNRASAGRRARPLPAQARRLSAVHRHQGKTGGRCLDPRAGTHRRGIGRGAACRAPAGGRGGRANSATTAWSNTGCPPPVNSSPSCRSFRPRRTPSGSFSSAPSSPTSSARSSAESGTPPAPFPWSPPTTAANACGRSPPHRCSNGASAARTAHSPTKPSAPCWTRPSSTPD